MNGTLFRYGVDAPPILAALGGVSVAGLTGGLGPGAMVRASKPPS